MSVLLFHVCRRSALQPFRTVHTRAWVAPTPTPVISLQSWTHGPRLRWWQLFAESGSIYSNSTIKPTLSALAAVETTLLSQPAPPPAPPPSLRIFGSGITNPKAAENRSSSLPSVFFFFLWRTWKTFLEKASAKPPSVTESQPWAVRKETILIKENKVPNLNSVTTIFSPAMLRFKVRNLTHPSCQAYI